MTMGLIRQKEENCEKKLLGQGICERRCWNAVLRESLGAGGIELQMTTVRCCLPLCLSQTATGTYTMAHLTMAAGREAIDGRSQSS